MNTLKEIKKLVKENGGVTLDSNRDIVSFNKGYIVSTKDNNFNTTNLRNITAKKLQEYCEKAKKMGGILGIYTRQDKSYDIDINKNFDDLQQALKFGIENNQEAIYDSAKQDVIFC